MRSIEEAPITLVTDCGRLFTYLHDKAYADPCSGTDGLSGVTEFESHEAGLQSLGMSSDRADLVLDRLFETHLIHRPSATAESRWMREHPGVHGKILLVEPCDELTAAAMLVTQL